MTSSSTACLSSRRSPSSTSAPSPRTRQPSTTTTERQDDGAVESSARGHHTAGALQSRLARVFRFLENFPLPFLTTSSLLAGWRAHSTTASLLCCLRLTTHSRACCRRVMTQQGATLQNYNNELVKCEWLTAARSLRPFCTRAENVQWPPLARASRMVMVTRRCACCVSRLIAGIEDLREKREEVNRSIAKDEEEKGAWPGFFFSRAVSASSSRGPSAPPHEIGLPHKLSARCLCRHARRSQPRSRTTCGS